MSRNPQFDALIKHVQDIHNRKNHDYSSDDNPYSNFEMTGLIAGVDIDTVFLTQIGNKIARLRELLKGKSPNFESIEDTRVDLATYACLYASYFYKVEVIPTSVGSKAPSADVTLYKKSQRRRIKK